MHFGRHYTLLSTTTSQLKTLSRCGLCYLINRRGIAEENEPEATGSAGVWIRLNCAVHDGSKLLKICLEILCVQSTQHCTQITELGSAA